MTDIYTIVEEIKRQINTTTLYYEYDKEYIHIAFDTNDNKVEETIKNIFNKYHLHYDYIVRPTHNTKRYVVVVWE